MHEQDKDADGERRFRGGKRPHLLFIRSPRPFFANRMGGIVPQDWRFTEISMGALGADILRDVDVLLLPDTHDQLYLKSIEADLVAYIAAGGHIVINGHITEPWLPCLSPFIPVAARPYTNWNIRPGEPGAYFGRMDFNAFHLWGGILGHYARGYTTPPAGAQVLCLVGGEGRNADGTPDEGAADWVWRMPGGGKVFMHNGDNFYYFYSDPRYQPNLFHDVLNALMFSDEPKAPTPAVAN